MQLQLHSKSLELAYRYRGKQASVAHSKQNQPALSLHESPRYRPRPRAHPPKPISYAASTLPQATLHMSSAQEPRQRMERMLRAVFCMRPKMHSAVLPSRVTPTCSDGRCDEGVSAVS